MSATPKLFIKNRRLCKKLKTNEKSKPPKNSFGHIDQIAVAPEFNGKGVAKKLYSHIELQFKKTLFITASLKNPAANMRSYDFFEKARFDSAGIFYTPGINGVECIRSRIVAKAID